MNTETKQAWIVELARKTIVLVENTAQVLVLIYGCGHLSVTHQELIKKSGSYNVTKERDIYWKCLSGEGEPLSVRGYQTISPRVEDKQKSGKGK